MTIYTNLLQKIDQDIGAQLKAMGVGKKRGEKTQFPCITISREFGCEGISISKKLALKLSSKEYPWAVFHRDLITELSGQEDLKTDLMEWVDPEKRSILGQYIENLLAHTPTNIQLYRKRAETLRLLAMGGRTVILGSGAAILTSDFSHMLHIRLFASLDYKVDHISSVLGIRSSEAKKMILEKEKRREDFIYEFTHKSVRDYHHYHLLIDKGIFSTDQVVEITTQALLLRGLVPAR